MKQGTEVSGINASGYVETWSPGMTLWKYDYATRSSSIRDEDPRLENQERLALELKFFSPLPKRWLFIAMNPEICNWNQAPSKGVPVTNKPDTRTSMQYLPFPRHFWIHLTDLQPTITETYSWEGPRRSFPQQAHLTDPVRSLMTQRYGSKVLL